MSLARTALRLAALNAIKGASSSLGPTIACNRCYDSRISDFTPETFPEDARPTVIVLTDDDGGESLSRQNGGPPFRRMVRLVFEFAMVQGFEDAGEFVPGLPATDAEHEASLDLLEFQILRRLAYDPDPACALFRRITRSWKYDCHRQVMDDSGVKIAARVLTIDTEVTDDQVIVYRTGDPTIPTGLDILPEPLKSVAKSLPQNSSSLAICNAIAAAISPPLEVGPFTGMDATVANTATGTDPASQFTAKFNPPQT